MDITFSYLYDICPLLHRVFFTLMCLNSIAFVSAVIAYFQSGYENDKTKAIKAGWTAFKLVLIFLLLSVVFPSQTRFNEIIERSDVSMEINYQFVPVEQLQDIKS